MTNEQEKRENLKGQETPTFTAFMQVTDKILKIIPSLKYKKKKQEKKKRKGNS